jgi:hypothetical protein
MLIVVSACAWMALMIRPEVNDSTLIMVWPTCDPSAYCSGWHVDRAEVWAVRRPWTNPTPSARPRVCGRSRLSSTAARR